MAETNREMLSKRDITLLLASVSPEVEGMVDKLQKGLDGELGLSEGEKRAIESEYGDRSEIYGCMSETERTQYLADRDSALEKIRAYVAP